MITCDECGKFKKDAQVGNNWICEDCRISVNSQLDTVQAQQRVKNEDSRSK
ncbi:MAG: hypothetical protein K0R67_2006 [Paenibacillus sp.]|nr:hypothetical protein [Paenibacillus sp.]